MADDTVTATATATPTMTAAVKPPSGAEIIAKAAEVKAIQDARDAAAIQEYLALPPRRSETIGTLIAALAKAQGLLKGVQKDSDNPFFKSKFASLAAGMEVLREPFSSNELAYVQLPTARGRTVVITTLLAHSSGEWIEERLLMTAKEDTPQALGSCITFGRRYALFAIAGLAPSDDDGEAATHEGMSKDVRWDKGKIAPEQAQPKQAERLQTAISPAEYDKSQTPAETAKPVVMNPQSIKPLPRPGPVMQPTGSTQAGSQASPEMGKTTSTPPPPGMRPPMRAPGT